MQPRDNVPYSHEASRQSTRAAGNECPLCGRAPWSPKIPSGPYACVWVPWDRRPSGCTASGSRSGRAVASWAQPAD